LSILGIGGQSTFVYFLSLVQIHHCVITEDSEVRPSYVARLESVPTSEALSQSKSDPIGCRSYRTETCIVSQRAREAKIHNLHCDQDTSLRREKVGVGD
jgi:hypothetical protein